MSNNESDSPSSSPSSSQRKPRGRGNGEGSVFKRDKGRGSKGPWYISWFDDKGKRREYCTKTTDRNTAGRILAKRIEEVAKRREGLVSVDEAILSDAGLKPLSVHLDDYLQDCLRKGQSPMYVISKGKAVQALMESGRAIRLSDLSSDLLMTYLAAMTRDGLSAGWCNYVRRVAIAFGNWCVTNKRLPINVMADVSKADEERDRRRVRRALTDVELATLLAVAEQRGRKAWYLTAAFAGLRFGDLGRLKWIDVDFEAGTLLIRNGKSGRDDRLPLHPELAVELRKRREAFKAEDADYVFPEIVGGKTRLRDFLAAGLAERVIVKNSDGTTKMRLIGKGRGRREVPTTKIVAKADGQGRIVDLHALRTTLATTLARAGVAPQVAQKIMRHADYRTTLKHYTILELVDSQNAMANIRVPVQATAAVAVDPVAPAVDTAVGVPASAKACEAVRLDEEGERSPTTSNRPVKPGDSASLYEVVRASADERRKGFEPSTFSLGS